MKYKIPTKRQRWARKRNHLLFRLKGARSVFGYGNCHFMNDLLPKDNFIVSTTMTTLDELIKRVSKSTYKE